MKSKRQEATNQRNLKAEELKAIAGPHSPEEVLKFLRIGRTANDPDFVLEETGKELVGKFDKQESIIPASNLYKSLTLLEFEKGILLISIVPEMYRTFAIDLSRRLQAEFDCQTASEKATAELAALNYVRALEAQNRINSYLTIGTFTEVGVKFLAIISKEFDRANRHFLTAVQVLKTMNQPPLSVSVKTQTAIIGQNQIVQAKND